MIWLPAAAAAIAFACAGIVGWDAAKRPRPERLIWLTAFLVFAVAAFAEVMGAVIGWSPALARVYYIAGAVLVVGILALGELYLLWPDRMPAIAPGIALLVAALAATAVWSAPVDDSRLAASGWHAIERGPLLIALAVSINAGGTLILVGGAVYSAFKIRSSDGSSRQAAGCLLIAVGTGVVALGGTLTRFGRPEYLYLAMAAGIAIIFTGVLLTRETRPRASANMVPVGKRPRQQQGLRTEMPVLAAAEESGVAASGTEGLAFVLKHILPLEHGAVADACRRWSATLIPGDTLTREQARQTWALRLLLPEDGRDRFDALPLVVQAQLGELYHQVWSGQPPAATDDHRSSTRRSLAIIHPVGESEGEAR